MFDTTFSDDDEKDEWVRAALEKKEFVKISLVLKGVQTIFNQSLMSYIMELGNTNLLMAMLASGVDVNGRCYKDLDDLEFGYLFSLAMVQDTDYLFNLLLLHPEIDLSISVNNDGFTSEEGWYYYQYMPLLRRLIDKPTYHYILPLYDLELALKACDANGQTLFYRAWVDNDLKQMDLLFYLGASIFPIDEEGWSPLDYDLYNRESETYRWYCRKLSDLFSGLFDSQVGFLGGLEEDIKDEVIKNIGLSKFFDEIEEHNEEVKLLTFEEEVSSFTREFKAKFPNLRLNAGRCNKREEILDYTYKIKSLLSRDDLFSQMEQKEQVMVPVYQDLNRIYPELLNDDLIDMHASFDESALSIKVKYKESSNRAEKQENIEVVKQVKCPDWLASLIIDLDEIQMPVLTHFQILSYFVNAPLYKLIQFNQELKEIINFSIFNDREKYRRAMFDLQDKHFIELVRYENMNLEMLELLYDW